MHGWYYQPVLQALPWPYRAFLAGASARFLAPTAEASHPPEAGSLRGGIVPM